MWSSRPADESTVHTGWRWRWGSRDRESLTERSRWIASWGMRAMGPVRASTARPEVVMRRPAMVSSRSSHEFHIIPP